MEHIADHKQTNAKARFDAFLAWPGYIVLLALLTEAANIFALELPVYTIFAALVLYCCVWGKDLLPVMPIFLYSYLAPSVQNDTHNRRYRSVKYMDASDALFQKH